MKTSRTNPPIQSARNWCVDHSHRVRVFLDNPPFQIDTAVNFLKNARVAKEPMERKRAFLQKKGKTRRRGTDGNEGRSLGLTDTEINYAFQLISATGETRRRSSFDLHRFCL